ncbi:MAG: hypothetical protein R2941_00290 [Desulfobacterales bacterium]
MRQYICESVQHSYAGLDVETVAGQIADTQYRSGEIPWFRGDKTDPWDHVESAMGLSIGGYAAEAGRAFAWLAENQLPDGSWYSAYRQGEPENRTRESHMAAYIAVGVYHYYLIHRDEKFLKNMWPAVDAALGFATGLQAKTGEIHWAVSPEGKPDPMALPHGIKFRVSESQMRTGHSGYWDMNGPNGKNRFSGSDMPSAAVPICSI